MPKNSKAAFDNILQAAKQIDDAASRRKALEGIAIAQIDMGYFSEAIITVQQTDSVWMWKHIVEAQAVAGNLEDAKMTAQQIDDHSERVEALVHIAKAQAKAGNLDDAGMTFDNALQVAKQIDNDARFSYESAYDNSCAGALRSIARAQAEVGNFDAAKTIIEQINDARVRDIELRDVSTAQDIKLRDTSIAQTKTGNFGDAITTTQQIKNDEHRVTALVSIAISQAETDGNFSDAGTTLENAFHVARQIDGDDCRARMLSNIATAEAEIGDFDGAKTTFKNALRAAGQIDENDYRARTLSNIAVAQAEVGDLEGADEAFDCASKAADQIDDSVDLAWALSEITIALTKTGYFYGAVKTAQRMPHISDEDDDEDNRDDDSDDDVYCDHNEEKDVIDDTSNLLIYIATAEAEAGNHNGAITTAWCIEDFNVQNRALSDIVDIQIKAGNFKNAKITAQHVSNTDERADILKDIASAQAGAGDFKDAKITAQQIDGAFLCDSTESSGIYKNCIERMRYTRDRALSDIVNAQAKADNFKDAEITAKQIHNAYYQALAFKNIASAQTEAGDSNSAKIALNCALDAAEQASAISGLKAIALRHIAAIQAKAGYFNDAKMTVNGALQAAKESSIYRRVSILKNIATTQIKMGDFNSAKATVQQIDSMSDRVSALSDIAATQAEAGDSIGAGITFGDALQAAKQIDSAFSRTWILREIAIAQAKAGYFTDAIHTTQSIERDDEKAEALVDIAKALAKQ